MGKFDLTEEEGGKGFRIREMLRDDLTKKEIAKKQAMVDRAKHMHNVRVKMKLEDPEAYADYTKRATAKGRKRLQEIKESDPETYYRQRSEAGKKGAAKFKDPEAARERRSKRADTLPNGLTVKQQQYVELRLGGYQPRDAYIEVYGEGSVNSWGRTERNPYVVAALKEHIARVREKLKEDLDLSLEGILLNLDEAIDISKEDRIPSVITNAAMMRAKLLGYVKDKRDINITSDIASMSNKELKELIEELDDADEDESEDSSSNSDE
jgi:hypothetical protein